MKIEEITKTIEGIGYTFTDNQKDILSQKSVVDIAKIQYAVSEALEAADRLKKELQKCFDFIRYVATPEAMDEAEIENIRVEGVGTVYLTSDYNVSIVKDQKEAAHDWLTENGHEDAIIETVNSSTLKSIIKKHLAAGDELPEGVFNVNPFTRAQIKK